MDSGLQPHQFLNSTGTEGLEESWEWDLGKTSLGSNVDKWALLQSDRTVTAEVRRADHANAGCLSPLQSPLRILVAELKELGPWGQRLHCEQISTVVPRISRLLCVSIFRTRILWEMATGLGKCQILLSSCLLMIDWRGCCDWGAAGLWGSSFCRIAVCKMTISRGNLDQISKILCSMACFYTVSIVWKSHLKLQMLPCWAALLRCTG